MEVTYYTNNGTERKFTRDTLEECIAKYYERRKSFAGANWGRVYINGERMWL